MRGLRADPLSYSCRLVATVALTRNENPTTVRYIVGTPVALRSTQPSQAITLVKPSAPEAKASPDPDMYSDGRASV